MGKIIERYSLGHHDFRSPHGVPTPEQWEDYYRRERWFARREKLVDWARYLTMIFLWALFATLLGMRH